MAFDTESRGDRILAVKCLVRRLQPPVNDSYYLCKYGPEKVQVRAQVLAGWGLASCYMCPCGQRKGTPRHLSSSPVLVTRRGFAQAGPLNPHSVPWRRYCFPHWTGGETGAQKGNVTCPAGFVAWQEFLTLGEGALFALEMGSRSKTHTPPPPPQPAPSLHLLSQVQGPQPISSLLPYFPSQTSKGTNLFLQI